MIDRRTWVGHRAGSRPSLPSPVRTGARPPGDRPPDPPPNRPPLPAALLLHRQPLHRATYALFAALTLVAAQGCGTDSRPDEGGPVRVVASVFPVADLVRGVGGIDVEVRTLLGPGASPATFDVTPRTLREVEGARVIFAVGGGLDTWALRLTDVAPDARTVTLLDGIPLEDDGHGEGTGNPHLWLDPVRTRDLLLPRIADALVEAIPHARSRIRQREGALADTLTALDEEIRRDLAGLPHRAFVASHPAWTYFAERYDLVQVGVVHEHPGQEPSPQALARIIRRARELRVPVVFSEPQIPDVGARALGGELGVPVLALDPIGGSGVDGRDSYVALLRYNTRQLVRGLGGPGGGE